MLLEIAWVLRYLPDRRQKTLHQTRLLVTTNNWFKGYGAHNRGCCRAAKDFQADISSNPVSGHEPVGRAVKPERKRICSQALFRKRSSECERDLNAHLKTHSVHALYKGLKTTQTRGELK